MWSRRPFVSAVVVLVLCGGVDVSLLVEVSAADVESTETIVSRLVAAARIYDKREMRAASDQLVQRGTAAVPGLRSILGNVDDNVRWQAVVALGRIGHPAAMESVPELVVACRDRDADVRGAAAVALGRLRARAAREAVGPLRLDGQPMVRSDAWWAWWQLTGDKRAVTQLVSLLSSKDWLASGHASEHLAAIGATAVPQLVERLSGGRLKSRRLAGETLRRMGPRAGKAIPKLLRLLNADDQKVAAISARVLGGQGVAAVSGLSDCLDSPRKHTRRLAVVALGEIGAASGIVCCRLSKELRVATGQELLQLVTALGRIGSTAGVAVPGLVAALGDENQDVRGAACEALGRIGLRSRSVVDGLEKVAQSDPIDFVRLAARNAQKTLRNNPDRVLFGERLRSGKRETEKGTL